MNVKTRGGHLNFRMPTLGCNIRKNIIQKMGNYRIGVNARVLKT